MTWRLLIGQDDGSLMVFARKTYLKISPIRDSVRSNPLTDRGHSYLIHSLGNLEVIKDSSMAHVSHGRAVEKIWLNSYKIVENFWSNERLKDSAFEGYLLSSSTITFLLPLSNLQEGWTSNNTNILY